MTPIFLYGNNANGPTLPWGGGYRDHHDGEGDNAGGARHTWPQNEKRGVTAKVITTESLRSTPAGTLRAAVRCARDGPDAIGRLLSLYRRRDSRGAVDHARFGAPLHRIQDTS